MTQYCWMSGCTSFDQLGGGEGQSLETVGQFDAAGCGELEHATTVTDAPSTAPRTRKRSRLRTFMSAGPSPRLEGASEGLALGDARRAPREEVIDRISQIRLRVVVQVAPVAVDSAVVAQAP